MTSRQSCAGSAAQVTFCDDFPRACRRRRFERAFAFYSAVLPVLGFELKFKEPEHGWAGWMMPGVARPLFLVGLPFNRKPASPGNSQMIALLAPDRGAVDRCHTTAVSQGGRSEGEPGLRPHYHANYYGAYFRDPAGNKLCVSYTPSAHP